MKEKHVISNLKVLPNKNETTTKWVYSGCGMCMNLCPIKVKVDNGIVKEIKGQDVPFVEGRICAKGMAIVDELYRPDRLEYPLKRIGKRGEGKFKRISWNEALEEIVYYLEKYRENGHPEYVAFLWGCPYQTPNPDLLEYFARVYGTPNSTDFHGASCYAPGRIANILTGIPVDVSPDYSEAKYGVEVGKNVAAGGYGPGGIPFNASLLTQGLSKGLELVVVDPRLSESASLGKWIPIKPGTDPAFLLGIMHTLIKKELYDVNFLRNYTNAPLLIRTDNGFPIKDENGNFLVWDKDADSAQPHDKCNNPSLSGKYVVEGIECKTAFQLLIERVDDYDPKKVAKICEVPNGEEKIIEVATKLGRLKPATFVNPCDATSAQYTNAFQKFRAIGIINALLGNFDKPGGLYFYPPEIKLGLSRIQKLVPELPVPRVDYDHQLFPFASTFLPVPQRWVSAVVEGKPYPLKVLFIIAVNPISLYNCALDIQEMLLKAEFVVAVDNWPNDIVDWADIVLPDTTFLERLEVQSVNKIYPYIIARFPVIEPPGECRPFAEVLIELGKRLGLSAFFDFSVEEWENEKLRPLGINLNYLREKGIYYKFQGKRYYKYPYKNRPNTPSGRIEIYSTILAENFYCNPGHPYYHNPHVDPLPRHIQVIKPRLRYNEFYLISGKSPITAHTRSVDNRLLEERYLDAGLYKHRIWINAQRAAELGIKDGDEVWVVSSATGAKARMKVKTANSIHPSAAFVYYGYGRIAKNMLLKSSKEGLNPNYFIPTHVEPLTGSLGHCQGIIEIRN